MPDRKKVCWGEPPVYKKKPHVRFS
jgi:hypothetical protein